MGGSPAPAALLVVALSLCALTPAAGQEPPAEREVLFQTSTINALLDGAYTGGLTVGELLQHGDTGIGTFDSLDGEMVVADGQAYQVLATGEVKPVDGGVATPFASATWFEADATLDLDQPCGLDALKATLDSLRASDNLFYAARVDGRFGWVKTRSVPRQERPFPPLAEVTRRQPEFEARDVEGSIVGFWCTTYVEGVNVSGWHLHFLSADRRFGGHLLDLTATRARVALDPTPEFRLHLPQTAEFLRLEVRAGRAEEIDEVER